jgi:hypothetical protein
VHGLGVFFQAGALVVDIEPLDHDPDAHVVLESGQAPYSTALHVEHKLLEEMLERPTLSLTVRHTATSHTFLHR